MAIVCLALTSPVGSDQSLQTIIQKLHCADSAEAAAQQLKNLGSLTLLPPGLPYTFSDSGVPTLSAANLSRTLSVLYQSAVDYPESKDLVEQSLIRWNFCSVIDNDHLYDHYLVDGQVIRKLSSSGKHEGFRKFGLLPGSNQKGQFRFSTPYTQSVISSLADQKHLQTYIKHCLPHPDDKHLYRSFGRNFISRIQHRPALPKPEPAKEWITECAVEPSAPEPPLTQKPKEKTHSPKLAAARTPDVSIEVTPPVVVPAPEVIPEPELIPEPEPVPVPVPVPASVVVTIPETTVVVPDDGVVVDLENPQTTDSTKTKPAPAVVTSATNSSSVFTTNINSSRGLSGSISLENRSFELSNTSLKLAFAYKPRLDSYWFIRSALNVSQESKPLTYSWGIGYDDWHPGTWAIQLNHWGPLKFGDGLDIKNAVAEVSYKFNKDWLKEHNLSGSVGLSKPISDKPVLSFGWSWNPQSHWFIRSTMIKPLDSDALNWSYGFGYTKYSHASWSIEYNNWGVNEFPKLNFKENGQLSLIYRWAM